MNKLPLTKQKSPGHGFCWITMCLWLLTSCTSNGNVQPPELTLSQHELVGHILDTRSNQFIEETALFNRILGSEYLLLGESHDNSRHHKLQARAINWLGQQQRSVSVSFEMISISQGELLQQHSFTTSSRMIELLNAEKSHWHYERNYKVVFDSVLAAGFKITPANINLNELGEILKLGKARLSDDVKLMLKRTPLSDEQTADLKDEIVEAHCNMIPVESTRPMVLAQRVRDAVMSLSLLNSKADKKVLIAGAGHTRTDRGVPFYLRNHDQNSRILSLAFVEVKRGVTGIDGYSERWGGHGLPFDYVWFTAAVQRKDPCEELKQHFRGKNKGDGETK